MSMNPDSSEEVDYSYFEYETLSLNTAQDSSGNGVGIANFEPLTRQGGLRPNQVAELVAVFVDVTGGAPESTGGNTTAYENRGVFGINLAESEDITSNSEGGNASSTEIVEGSYKSFETSTQSEAGILQPFRVVGQGREHYEKNWRELTGRGPVVDANDSLTIINTSINESVDNNDFQILVHLVYDIFEMDNARTTFSVPRR